MIVRGEKAVTSSGEVVVLRETWDGVDDVTREYLETQAVVRAVRGQSDEQIMTELGLSRALVHSSIKNALRRRRAMAVDEHRAIQDAAYDALLDALWDKAQNGVRAPLEGVLRILEAKSRLWGTEQPKRAEVRVSVREEVDNAFAMLEAVLVEAKETSEIEGTGEVLELERGSE